MTGETATGARVLALAERPDAAGRVARWYVDEWSPPDRDPVPELARVLSEMRRALGDGGLPSTWLAEDDGAVIGAAQLKRREVPALDAFEHWLGGVYVAPPFRGRGTARRLIERCVEDATKRGVERLHLQTEVRNVGLYERLGWTTAELPPGLVHERPVMVRPLER